MEEAQRFKGEPDGAPSPQGVPYSPPKRRPCAGRAGTDGRIRELLRDHPRGLTADAVGKALSLSRSTAARRLSGLARAGGLEVQTYGQTRVFTLTRQPGLDSILRKPSPLVLILSPGLQVIGVNDPLLSVFRVGREDLVGKKITSSPLAPPLEQVIGEIRRGTGETIDLPEVECLIGEARYIFRAVATPLSGPRGPAGTLLSLEDVTAATLHRRRIGELMDSGTLSLLSSNPRMLDDILSRRREEESLRLIRSSVEQAGIPALWIGRDGGLLMANHAAGTLLGYPEEELARMTFAAIGPDLPDGAWDALWAALDIRPEVRFEGRFRTKGGNSVPVEIRASRIRHGDREFGLLIGEDITGRKEEEAAGRNSEAALREANERLNLLAAITRHDCLNDIAALGMYLDLAESGTAEGPGRAVREKMASLVGALREKLEFTRTYAGLGMRTPGWEDLTVAVRRGIACMDTGPVSIDLDLPPLEIYADPLFDRAIANLVDNSLRHGEHATLIRISALPDGETCTLLVEDDGVGIPHGKKEAAFRSGYGRSAGLGLFLVREILGITGMDIRETGEPGRGARFEIRIPAGGFRGKEGSGGAQVHDGRLNMLPGSRSGNGQATSQ